MILVKGNNVSIQWADETWFSVPARMGIIHDPDGQQLERCSVFLGPYRKTPKRFGRGQHAPLTRDAEAYFGPDYVGTGVVVDVPAGPWSPLGEAIQIRYYRPGKHEGRYFHMFNEKTVTQVSVCKRSTTTGRTHYRVELPNGCIVNWRGFVYP